MFQQRMDQILEEVEGVVSIANDTIIHGQKENKHDTHICHLMQIACKYGLVFSAGKCDLKAKNVMFFGCLYDCNGILPDPAKVVTIANMPAPISSKKIQEFLGMATHLRNFIS